MEHDWNPMKDLQAMDRAHLVGQRKVVNVHCLIMRGTLEEKASVLPSSSSGEQRFQGEIQWEGLEVHSECELWDQSQYADKYDLNQFLAKLNG